MTAPAGQLAGASLVGVNEGQLAEAQRRAALVRQFQSLRAEGFSLRNAAAQLGVSPATFSGATSLLARFETGGLAGVVRAVPAHARAEQFPVPDWFIPAAKCFWLWTNRTWNSGSMPEAVLRVISLPECPPACRPQLLRLLKDTTLPTCPPKLRALILARQRAGRPLLPRRLARQIRASAATVQQFRNPTEAGLNLLSAPGSAMWRRDASGARAFTRAGDWIEADDGTINFPVVIPWTMGGCPCSDKYGVKVGRFQFLRPIDAGSRYRPGYIYVARPKGSYRREDVLALMRMVCRSMGIPRGWRFERGTWESNMVKDAVAKLGSQLQTVYSPRGKAFVESGFNQDWTKLSAHFPNAQVGRFMGETEEANVFLTKAKNGTQDPRDLYPTLGQAITAFDQITAEENRTPVNSPNWGRWVPEERFQEHLAANPLPAYDTANDWIFSPYVRDWTVRGMLVGGKVPIFEEVSVPFDFSADWLPNFSGAKVRCYFDPADPDCSAMVVLQENHGQHRAGEILGTARQINETAGYVRLVMGWGHDPVTAGHKARQQAAAAMRREVRAIVPRRSPTGSSEMRDGLGQRAIVEISGAVATSAPATNAECGNRAAQPVAAFPSRAPRGADDNRRGGNISEILADKTTAAAEAAAYEQENPFDLA